MAYIAQIQNEKWSGDNRSLRIERALKVTPYTGVLECISDLVGGVVRVGAYLIRKPPMYHPTVPWLRCTGFSVDPLQQQQVIDGLGSVSGALGHLREIVSKNPDTGEVGSAIVNATYSLPTLEQSISGSAGGTPEEVNSLLEESYEFSTKALSMPKTYFEWDDGTQDTSTDESERPQVYKSFTKVEARFVRHHCINIPWATVTALCDKVNFYPLQLVNNIFAAETVRFDGIAATRRLTSAQGIQYYEITYKFTIQPTYEWISDFVPPGVWTTPAVGYVGWNRFFDFERNIWHYKIRPGMATRQYVYLHDKDFSTIGSYTGFTNLFNPKAT